MQATPASGAASLGQDSHRQQVYRCLSLVCKPAIQALLHDNDAPDHLAVPLHFLELADQDSQLAVALLQTPRPVLVEMDCVLGIIKEEMEEQELQAHSQALALPGPRPPARFLHVRLHSLPFGPENNAIHPSIGAVGSLHINRLVVVTGTVVRASSTKMLACQQMYECTRCHLQFPVKCKLEDGGKATLPVSCPRQARPCAGVKFRPVPHASAFTGFQEIKVQEKSQHMAMGALPAALTVVLQDELVEQTQAGDDVEIIGVITQKWKPFLPTVRCEAELVLVANNVQVLAKKAGPAVEIPPAMEKQFEDFWEAHRATPLAGRNKILRGICPQIHGMLLVKLATALSLSGGVSRSTAGGDGTRLRGDVHLLLIGDPGIGKSQIMKFAARASHRSVMASGRGSSSAGLTVTAIKEDNSWVLEAGALMLADGGVCCIDEFDGIREADRAVIHEAMEQQTIHVAKAGILATLSTRTTVIAAVNPKPSWRSSQPISEATKMSGPLLSRFDIVLLLLDTRHPAWDTRVSGCVLDNHQQGAQELQDQLNQSSQALAEGFAPSESQAPGSQSDEEGQRPADIEWTLPVMRSYLLWIRHRFQPTMTCSAEKVLKTYYQALRQGESRSASRTTIRMLESLVRIAQAHARLRASQHVELVDAAAAVIIIESGTSCLGIMQPDGAIFSDFHEEPDVEGAELQATIVHKLGLELDQLLLQEQGHVELLQSEADARRQAEEQQQQLQQQQQQQQQQLQLQLEGGGLQGVGSQHPSQAALLAQQQQQQEEEAAEEALVRQVEQQVMEQHAQLEQQQQEQLERELQQQHVADQSAAGAEEQQQQQQQQLGQQLQEQQAAEHAAAAAEEQLLLQLEQQQVQGQTVVPQQQQQQHAPDHHSLPLQQQQQQQQQPAAPPHRVYPRTASNSTGGAIVGSDTSGSGSAPHTMLRSDDMPASAHGTGSADNGSNDHSNSNNKKSSSSSLASAGCDAPAASAAVSAGSAGAGGATHHASGSGGGAHSGNNSGAHSVGGGGAHSVGASGAGARSTRGSGGGGGHSSAQQQGGGSAGAESDGVGVSEQARTAAVVCAAGVASAGPGSAGHASGASGAGSGGRAHAASAGAAAHAAAGCGAAAASSGAQGSCGSAAQQQGGGSAGAECGGMGVSEQARTSAGCAAAAARSGAQGSCSSAPVMSAGGVAAHAAAANTAGRASAGPRSVGHASGASGAGSGGVRGASGPGSGLSALALARASTCAAGVPKAAAAPHAQGQVMGPAGFAVHTAQRAPAAASAPTAAPVPAPVFAAAAAVPSPSPAAPPPPPPPPQAAAAQGGVLLPAPAVSGVIPAGLGPHSSGSSLNSKGASGGMSGGMMPEVLRPLQQQQQQQWPGKSSIAQQQHQQQHHYHHHQQQQQQQQQQSVGCTTQQQKAHSGCAVPATFAVPCAAPASQPTPPLSGPPHALQQQQQQQQQQQSHPQPQARLQQSYQHHHQQQQHLGPAMKRPRVELEEEEDDIPELDDELENLLDAA